MSHQEAPGTPAIRSTYIACVNKLKPSQVHLLTQALLIQKDATVKMKKGRVFLRNTTLTVVSGELKIVYKVPDDPVDGEPQTFGELVRTAPLNDKAKVQELLRAFLHKERLELLELSPSRNVTLRRRRMSRLPPQPQEFCSEWLQRILLACRQEKVRYFWEAKLD